MPSIVTSRTWFLTALIGVSLNSIPLFGNWSQPQEVIYPGSPPYNASFPSIAMYANGDAIALWCDSTGSGSLQVARWTQGAVNGGGQPVWVAIDSPSPSNTRLSVNPLSQIVAVDGAGNAISVGTDAAGSGAYASFLPTGSSSWINTTQIGSAAAGYELNQFYVAMAPNGNAVVCWDSLFSNHPYDTYLSAAVYINGNWLPPVNLFTRPPRGIHLCGESHCH